MMHFVETSSDTRNLQQMEHMFQPTISLRNAGTRIFMVCCSGLWCRFMFKNQEVNLSGPRFTIVWPDGIGRAHHLPLDEAKSSVSCEELHREVLNIIDKLTSLFTQRDWYNILYRLYLYFCQILCKYLYRFHRVYTLYIWLTSCTERRPSLFSSQPTQLVSSVSHSCVDGCPMRQEERCEGFRIWAREEMVTCFLRHWCQSLAQWLGTYLGFNSQRPGISISIIKSPQRF